MFAGGVVVLELLRALAREGRVVKGGARGGGMAHGIRPGQMVYGSLGARLGRVLQCDASGLVIEKGLAFTEDYAVDSADVSAVTADGVHLKIRGSTLVAEEEVGSWETARDPVGNAGGVDVEPLRAGMEEIVDRDEADRAHPEGNGKVEAGQRTAVRRGDRRRAEAFAREARLDRAMAPRPAARRGGGAPPPGPSDRDVERRIEEEIDDVEREASCAPRVPRPPARAPAAPAATAATSAPAPPSAASAARPRREAAPRPNSLPSRRLDYRAAAPQALAAMGRLESYVRHCGLEPSLLELVKVRASQLNGCAFCIDMHTKDARRAGESEQRLYALPAWREAPFFTERERAALAWTDAVTRLGPDHVDDETFRHAHEQFGDTELVNLTMAIVVINGWNRLAIAFRTEPGSYHPAD